MNSTRRRFRIENKTSTNILSAHLMAFQNDDENGINKDFFKGVSIPAGKSSERPVKISERCSFGMILKFEDGLEDNVGIILTQRNDCVQFHHLKKTHNIFYRAEHENLLTLILENREETCDGNYHRLLKVLQNKVAEATNRSAETLLKQKEYQKGLQELDKALQFATEVKTKERIEDNKRIFRKQYGMVLLEHHMTGKSDVNENSFKIKLFKIREEENLVKAAELQLHILKLGKKAAKAKAQNQKQEELEILNSALRKQEELKETFEKLKNEYIRCVD